MSRSASRAIADDLLLPLLDRDGQPRSSRRDTTRVLPVSTSNVSIQPADAGGSW